MAIERAIRAPLVQRNSTGRWFYVSMAALFAVVTTVGFAPGLYRMAMSPDPGPPAIWHIHGALMAGWLLLFLAQASLVASHRPDLHRRLGLASLALAPAMIVAIAALTVRAGALRSAMGQDEFVAKAVFASIGNATLFAILFVLALITRNNAPEMHKRMMVLATFVLVGAATVRMQWLPEHDGPLGEALNHFVLLAPALVFDLVRTGRIHNAYLLGVVLYWSLPVSEALIVDTPWWIELVPRLVGVGG